MAKFYAGLGAIGAAGFIPFKGGRLWDYYLKVIRGIEEVSPGKVFRTFRFSELFSPLGTHKTIDIGPDLFSHTIKRAGKQIVIPNVKMREFVANMLDVSMAQAERLGIFTKGLEFRRTGAVLGELAVKGGQVLSKTAMPMQLGRHAGGSFIDWWARVTGVKLGMTEGVARMSSPSMFAVTVPKIDKVLGIPLSESASLIFQRFRLVSQYQRAYWAAQIGRLNTLLQAPAEWFPFVRRGMEKIGIKTFGVAPGTATQMLLRYAAKGTVIAGGVLALSYLSHKRKTDNKLIGTLRLASAGSAVGAIIGRGIRGSLIGAGIGALIGVAPLFNQGIFEGAATAYTRVAKTGAAVSQKLGMTEAAKEQEALMPGVTKVSTLVGMAGGMMMSGLTAGYFYKLYRYKKYGIEATEEVMAAQRAAIKAHAAQILEKSPGWTGKIRAWLAERMGMGVKGETFFRRAGERLLVRGGWSNFLLGAGIFGVMAMAGAIATGHLVPGIFAAEHTPEELEQIYSGEEYVPVRKGRWWEFGVSPWEGGRISYYRPHWYALMMSKARTIGLYGSEEERWQQSAMLHPFKALFSDEFKYRWERQHYYDRPYPVTGTYFEDIPFIGPLLAATFGKLIKPSRIMHAEEWMMPPGATVEQAREGRAGVLHRPTAAAGEPAYELGGIPPGVPASKLNATQTIGETIYRINELRGLPGFVHGAIKEAITGSQDYFDQQMQLEAATRATGAERSYWDLELGGLAGFTEAYRRFNPHRRRQIEQYNPLRNRMPTWLPGEEYYIDFLHGDPFTKVAMGEIRLPGPGYAALNPEVKGLSPEQYPLFHRFKILADVAMYSDQFKQARSAIRAAIRRGELNEHQIAQVEKINRQVSEKKKRKRFNEYRFSQKAADGISEILQRQRVVVDEVTGPMSFVTSAGHRVKMAGLDITGQKGTTTYRRKQVQVADYLREYIYPGAELDIYVHRDPLHTYKKDKGGYYQPAAIKTATGESIAEGLVKEGLAQYQEEGPESIFAAYGRFSAGQRKLGALWEFLTHYEDPLARIVPLNPQAKFIHRRSAIEEYERSRVWATDAAFWQHPIEQFVKPAYWLARREYLGTEQVPEKVRKRWYIEDYFDKLKWLKYNMLERYAEAHGMTKLAQEFKRQQRRTLFGVNPYGSLSNIYSALPSLDRDYYEAFANAATREEREYISKMLPPAQRRLYQARWDLSEAKAIRAHVAAGKISQTEARARLETLHRKQISEGRRITPQLWSQYKKEMQRGESYADWARRKELTEYFSKAPLPGPNWVGFHPHVDLEDIKLSIVERLGEDMHEYNLWPSRRRRLIRKPYINRAAPLTSPAGYENPPQLRATVESTLRDLFGMTNVRVNLIPAQLQQNELDIQINDTRDDVIQRYKYDPGFMEMM